MGNRTLAMGSRTPPNASFCAACNPMPVHSSKSLFAIGLPLERTRTSRLTLRSLLGVDGGFFAHGSEDDDVCKLPLALSFHFLMAGCGLTGVFSIIGEELGDLVADVTFWDLDILLLRAVVGHEGEEAVVSDVELLITHQYHSIMPLHEDRSLTS